MKLSNVAIVTMRTSSTRLPKKSLADITNTKKSIDIIIERAKLTGLPVVFATSSDESDDQIADIAKSHGVVIFRGALLNKLKRFCLTFVKSAFIIPISFGQSNNTLLLFF